MLPLVETLRLRLRPFTEDDAPAIYDYARDPEIARLGMWPAPAASLEATRGEIAQVLQGYASGMQWTWAVERMSDQAVIGRCDLLKPRPVHRNAELGYALARHAWGQGYATEALTALLRIAFADLALHRVEALVLSFNRASIHVLEKLGMRREGVKREAYLLDGQFVDLFCYARLANDR